MPKSSSTHFASTAHKTVHDALHNHFALRTAKIRDTHYMMSKVYSQVYESGPVAWRVSVHADDRGGDGPYTAQVTVSCERKTGEVTYFGEPRRNPKTGDRYAPSNANLSFCTKVAGKVAERAEVTTDPHRITATKNGSLFFTGNGWYYLNYKITGEKPVDYFIQREHHFPLFVKGRQS